MTVNVQIKNKFKFFSVKTRTPFRAAGSPPLFRKKTVYNKNKVCYNYTVKHLALLTTAFTLLACASGGAAAYADESPTQYPQAENFTRTLEFSALSDFAADGDNYAFADGKSILIYRDGTLEKKEADRTVSRLEYSDGALYYADGAGAVFTADNSPAAFVMPEVKVSYDVGENYNYRLQGDKIKFTDYGTDTITALSGDYTRLKTYGDALYAVTRDSVCVIEQTDVKPFSAELEYFFDAARENGISLGNTATLLKDYTLKFVTLQAGAYRTEVDLTDLGGEAFVIKGDTEKLTQNVSALLLCYTGNAAVVAVGDRAYVTLNSPSSLVETEIDCYVAAEFETATVTGDGIYMSPFVIIDPSAHFPATGAVVKILHKMQPKDVLGSVFYEVEYTDGEQTGTGYVSDGFLTEYIFDDSEPKEHPDPAHSESNNVQTVILVLILVILILAAVAYLIFVGIPRRKHKEK